MSLFRRTSEPTAPAPAPSAQPPSSGTGAAISLEKVQRSAPGLVDLYKRAGVSLQKRGLTGQRAAVYLVLDRSGSMRPYYSNGSVQHLAEQALGLSANLDDDGTVPLVFFDHRPYPAVDIDLYHYTGHIAMHHNRLGSMGGTEYAPAIHAVMTHYQESGAADPAFVIFQTDGEPSDARNAEQALKDASHLPLFWAFVGFGSRFQFLQKLDTMGGRAVDNASFFAAGVDPRAMSDEDLYDRLMAEYPQWLTAARTKGILA